MREPLRRSNVYPFDSGYGSNLLQNTGAVFNDPRLSTQVIPGYASFDSRHFNGQLPMPLLPLPPYQVQQQQQNLSRTDQISSGSTRNHQTAFSSAFDLEVERLQGQWTLPQTTTVATATSITPVVQQLAPPVFQFDERRNMNGSSTAIGLGESVDIISSSSMQPRRSVEDIITTKEGNSTTSGTSGNGKPRFTLDDHMARSPKASPKTKVDPNSRINPSYMSIPAFVPHHSQSPQSRSTSLTQISSPQTQIHSIVEPLRPQPPVLPPMKQVLAVEVINNLSTLPLLPPTLPPLPSLPVVLPTLPILNSQSLPPIPAFNSLPALPKLSTLPELPVLPPTVATLFPSTLPSLPHFPTNPSTHTLSEIGVVVPSAKAGGE